MRLNYYLKDKYTDSETNIILYFRYNGKRLRYYTGIKIKPKQWNEAKQYIYVNGQKTKQLNDKLKVFKKELENEYEKQISLGIIPKPEFFKEYLDQKFKAKQKTQPKIKQPSFNDYFKELIQYKKKFNTDSTIKKYSTLQKHLKDIEKHYRIKLNINSFNKAFYYNYIDYFIHLGQLNSTIKEKHIKTMNAVLNWFVEMEYIEKNEFKGIKFPYKINPADTISLNEEELHKLYDLDLSKNTKLRQVRDVFCLECFTGLRYSETKKVNKDSRSGRQLKLFTEKNTVGLDIPLRQEAMNILDIYFNNDLPLPVISNQKMNDYLKELGKICEFNTPITILKISGKNKEETVKKKYELISTHTGRRTFVTLAYQKGMKPLDIMQITRHKSYDTFMKYYRLEHIDVHKKFFESWENLQPKYSTLEIIKSLIIKNVSLEIIATSFGIDIVEIKRLVT